jgi:hypothetical protein
MLTLKIRDRGEGNTDNRRIASKRTLSTAVLGVAGPSDIRQH